MREVQIIGTLKHPDVRRAIRFFRDRSRTVHVRDLSERPFSPGEIQNIADVVGTEALIDPESSEYRKLGLAHMEFDPVEELLDHPLIARMPIARFGREVTVGVAEERWAGWIKEMG